MTLFSCLPLCLDKNMLCTSKYFNVNLQNMMINLFYDLQIYGIEITYEI